MERAIEEQNKLQDEKLQGLPRLTFLDIPSNHRNQCCRALCAKEEQNNVAEPISFGLVQLPTLSQKPQSVTFLASSVEKKQNNAIEMPYLITSSHSSAEVYNHATFVVGKPG